MHKNGIIVKSFNFIMEVTNIVDIMSEYNIFSSADRKLELLEFYQGYSHKLLFKLFGLQYLCPCFFL